MLMQIEEFRSAVIASVVLLSVSSYLLYMRIIGNPFFEEIFEVCLFHFPAALLVGYSFYLRIRSTPQDQS